MKPIRIVGGGLAGLALGIGLRRAGVPVTVTEAGAYPRHRVCGEFISGRGLHSLQRLGLEPLVASARRAATSAFFIGARNVGMRELPQQAMCISRYRLDAALASEFELLGGSLHTGTRHEGAEEPGVVFATGRRADVGSGDRWRWFGIKAHARDVALEADLEMHIDTNSYVGLCRLGDGVVNVCGLFRRRAGEHFERTALRGLRGTALFQRLDGASFDAESHCAIAGLCLEPQPIDETVCRVGDALTMIPPITGNGMSMAFECAAMAVAPIAQYARGERQWMDAIAAIAQEQRRAFENRLNWAARLHGVLFSEVARDWLLPVIVRHDWAWRGAFAATR